MEPEDLAKILDDLGRRIGPTGEYVFALAVRQVIIDGLVWLAATAVLVGLAIVVTRIAQRGFAEFNTAHPPGDNEHFGINWRVAAYCGIWTIATLALVVAVGGTLGRLLNPEYAAIRDILGAIR